MNPEERLSIIVASRNDGHGGDLIKRLSLFTDALLDQANRHGLRGELIVVDWNPPPGLRLHEVVQLHNKSDRFSIRFLEVPPEVHRALPHADALPFFQMIAKNVGIRRARGRFVLATNPDLLFSERLVRFLASADLDPGRLYRIDRHDVRAEIPMDATLEEQLAWCDQNVLRVHTKRGSFPSIYTLRARLARLPRALRRGLADAYRRILRAPTRGLTADRLRALGRVLRMGAAGGLQKGLRGLERSLDPLPTVHTNACGDFTLLSREVWLSLRGYPELPIWSMHIDSALCYMAVAAGLRQQVLRPPAKIYHPEHPSSWVVMTLEEKLHSFTRKPWIDTALIDELWREMYRSGRPIRFNGEDWGCAHHPLAEVEIRSGERSHVPSPGVAPAQSE